jgi:hypothetical protein
MKSLPFEIPGGKHEKKIIGFLHGNPAHRPCIGFCPFLRKNSPAAEYHPDDL